MRGAYDFNRQALTFDNRRTNWLSVAILWWAGIAAAMQFAKLSVAFEEIKTQYGASTIEMGFVGSRGGGPDLRCRRWRLD